MKNTDGVECLYLLIGSPKAYGAVGFEALLMFSISCNSRNVHVTPHYTTLRFM